MMKRLFSLILGLTLVLPSSLYSQTAPLPVTPAGSAANAQVGVAAVVKGLVKIGSPQVGRNLKSGEPIHLGDEITTDEKGHLQILLLDQTIFTIGPNSSITIDTFIYDPSTHDGKVHAKVAKGVFRFVTGKIGQKKPQDMEIELPAGTIGIRGTIAGGKVEGQKSLVVLFGPGDKNNTPHRDGKLLVSNPSQGGPQEVVIDRAGFGTTIDGEGAPPARPFQVPAALMNEMTQALSSSSGDSESEESGSDSKGGDSGDDSGDSKGGDSGGGGGGGGKSASSQAGQDKAGAIDSIDVLNVNSEVLADMGDESKNASQDFLDDEFDNIFFDIATYRQLASLSGVATYVQNNVKLFDSGGSQVGTYDISVVIDFGNTSIGGGGSSITGTINSTFNFDLHSIDFDSFADENFPAFFYWDSGNTTSNSPCLSNCSVEAVVFFNNDGGDLATSMSHIVTVQDNSGTPTEGIGFGEANP